MSHYKVTLQVPVYLQQWMHTAFGNPVQLIRDSPESHLLCQMLRKTPEEPEVLEMYGETFSDEEKQEAEQEKAEEGNLVTVEIEIPLYKSKPPHIFSVLNVWGKQAMVESFKTLFKKDILNSISHLKNSNCKQKTLIYNYMEEHGIEIENYDTVKQIYYRNISKYRKKFNIKL